jgi:two-component system chemotaxis response regulator CheB
VIRVLLVDDSPIALHILQRLLSRSTEIQVVGTAAEGREALGLVRTLDPDVICTDLHMPVMDGLEFTREVMANYPRPILVVSVAVEPGSPNIFRLLEAGALDVYAKPRDILNVDMDKLAQELSSKIRILAGVHVFRRSNNSRGAPVAKLAPKPSVMLRPQTPVRIVVIGASTGGPQALHQILADLPTSFSVPIVCIQHIGSNFLSEMVKWLAKVSPLPVCKAEHGMAPQAGTVYFAPEDAHLELDPAGRFALSLAAPLDGHRPSVTVTMCAAARVFRAGALGVLLTGMGRDGAEGMASIAAAGGITIVQDEATSVVYGMARQAVEMGAVLHILPLQQIAPALDAILKAEFGAWNKSNPELKLRSVK